MSKLEFQSRKQQACKMMLRLMAIEKRSTEPRRTIAKKRYWMQKWLKKGRMKVWFRNSARGCTSRRKRWW